MAVLGNIWSVEVIMIFNRSLIFVIDLREELQKLVIVYCLQKIILLKQRSRHKRQLIVSPHTFGEFKNVKVVWVHAIIEMKIVFDQLFNMVTRNYTGDISINWAIKITPVKGSVPLLFLEKDIFLAHLCQCVGRRFVHNYIWCKIKLII